MIEWLRRRPLRSRLAIWYALGSAILFSLFGAGVYYFVASRMARPLDFQLRKDEATIRNRLVVSNDSVVRWDGKVVGPDIDWASHDPWFELWDETGKLVCRFWSLDESSLSNLPTTPVRNRETISIFRVSSEVRLRVLTVPIKVLGQERAWMLRVMRLHRRSADSLGALLVIIAISLPLVVFVLVFGGYRLTLHWLRPLESLVHATTQIKADNLAFRLPIANPHDEIGQLTAAFNRTLDRLEASYSALNRFVADASHELRTPLSALRTVGEVALSSGKKPSEYRDIIGSMLEEAQRLHRLVERLLELARAEGGGHAARLTQQHIDVLVQECAEEMKLLADEKSQTLTIVTQAEQAWCDADLFRQALRNLVENAIKYSPSHTAIEVRMNRRAEGVVEVLVSDEGPGIALAHREQVMDRFFRSDRALGHERSGFGLGLAIARAYLQAMDGELEFRPAEPHGCVFKLRLKAVP